MEIRGIVEKWNPHHSTVQVTLIAKAEEDLLNFIKHEARPFRTVQDAVTYGEDLAHELDIGLVKWEFRGVPDPREVSK